MSEGAARAALGRPEPANESAAPSLACPIHKTALDEFLFCAACARRYPTVGGIPVLLNDENSVFATADYVNRTAYGGASAYAGHLDASTGLRQCYRRAMSRLSETAPPKRDFDVGRAIDQILAALPAAEILVIGSGDTTLKGRVTYTDVALGKNVRCIADAHDLPFVAGSFDACVAVAVLEHVVDPYRCVAEIRRVLRPGGYVYAETPFMQPVHMQQHDFTRFTHLGHRRLFRQFEEIRSGMAGGPGTSLGQLLRQAIVSLSDKPTGRKWLRAISLVLAYPLRWLDYLSHSHLAAYDAASAFYFFGRLAEKPISDRELLRMYRGG